MSTDKPIDETEPIITEATIGAEPITEAKPIDDAKPIDETQPIDTNAPIAPTQPFAPIPRTEPVQDTAPLAGAGSATGNRPDATGHLSRPTPTTSVATPSTPEPAATATRPTLRVGTVVWGLILAVIGAGVIAVAAGARFDLQLAFIGLLALGGIGLLAGSIATSVRHRNR